MARHAALYRCRSRRQRPRRAGRPPGFTLVELLISVALVLILILGINQVFSITSQGVAGGQALSTVIRDNRAAQSVFYEDLESLVMPRNASGGTFDDGPGFVIRSDRQYAYRNRADHLSDPDGAVNENPGVTDIRDRDLNADNDETDAGEDTFAAIYNDRSHRLDQMIFFARDQYRRQTGGTFGGGVADDPYVAPMSSQEAYIWYGHLKLPDFTTPMATQEFAHRNPGDVPYTTNRENAYATSWALGRVVMTMRAKDAANQIVDDGGKPQTFIDRPGPSVYNTLAPFWDEARDNDTGDFRFTWTRYDLVATTISEYGNVLRGYHNLWLASGLTPNPLTRWDYRMTSERHQANPIPNRPLDSFGVARTAPIFLRGCTQFIVEFAGDFVTQDDRPFLNGNPANLNAEFGRVFNQNPPVPDGVTDFVVHFNDANSNGLINPAENGTVRRVTRWYGMPRDTNGDGVIPGWYAAPLTTTNLNNLMPDVVPLRDVVSSGLGALYAPALDSGRSIEKFDTLDVPTNANRDYVGAAGGMTDRSRYFASWGPDTPLAPKPRMIRITLALDEPAASMASEQTYEYVIELP